MISSKDSKSAWGEERTRFFFELTPDRVLEAVETTRLRCTGLCHALNSFENRVYDVELDLDEDAAARSARKSVSVNRRVVKFYRPGRWSREQILEEHEFLYDLRSEEIPAIAPLTFPTGETLRQTSQGIWYAVFPKVGGRAPDELSEDQLVRLGRLLGRVHNVGAAKKAQHRVELNVETYGQANLDYLLSGEVIPLEFRSRYEVAAREIFRLTREMLIGIVPERVHGDCHLGNILWNDEGPFFLDFDDMVRGPAVQDIWLMVPGRDEEARRQREILIRGYEEMRDFDRVTLRLIEPLRALRFIHYTAWVSRRWDDPIFPQSFPEFGSYRYWSDETKDLEEQLRWMRAGS